MLPPGHVAAGFLVAETILKITKPDLPALQLHQLLYWGMFFSFVPDLDSFISFAKEKSFAVRDPDKNDHRNFISHAPVIWLIGGLSIYFFSGSEYFKILGLLLWLCSWSHFIFDSIEPGIMWLWPFSKKRYYLIPAERIRISEPTFLGYWIIFLKAYTRRVTFYCEIAVLILGIYQFTKLVIK